MQNQGFTQIPGEGSLPGGTYSWDFTINGQAGTSNLFHFIINVPECGDPGDGSGGGGTGGGTGPDLSWWEAFKNWLADLFTMSSTEAAQWSDVKSSVSSWGPIGWFGTIGNEFAGYNPASETPVVGPDAIVSLHSPPDVGGGNAGAISHMSWDTTSGNYSWSASSGSSGSVPVFPTSSGSLYSWPGKIAAFRALSASLLYVGFLFFAFKRILPMVFKALS